jgi:Kef-type K+ transport system membrane component KefB
MVPVLPLLGALFFVYLFARGLGELALRLRLPALVGEIIAGIVIANVALGSFHLEAAIGLSATSTTGTVSIDALTTLADIGIVFLAFAVGLEILPSAVRRVARSAAKTAAWGTTLPFVFGFTFLIILDGPGAWPAALFAGVALAVSSLVVTARLLREHQLLGMDEAHVILGAALIEDVVGAVALTIVLALTAESDHGPIDLVYQVGILVAGAVISALFFLVVAPPLLRRYAARPSRPHLATQNAAFVLALLLCLGAAALASTFQVASIVGAVLAGMALAEFRDRFDLRARFEALNTFFVPFFFAGIGLLVSTNELLAIWPIAAALTVLAVAGKLASVPAESRNLGRRGALRVGSGLIPRGEVAILVAVTAFGSGLITGDLYSAIVVMAIVTSVIGPILLHRLSGGGAPGTETGTGQPEPAGV